MILFSDDKAFIELILGLTKRGHFGLYEEHECRIGAAIRSDRILAYLALGLPIF